MQDEWHGKTELSINQDHSGRAAIFLGK